MTKEAISRVMWLKLMELGYTVQVLYKHHFHTIRNISGTSGSIFYHCKDGPVLVASEISGVRFVCSAADSTESANPEPHGTEALSREKPIKATVNELYHAYGGSPIPNQHGTAATRGHCAGNGGLRGHSVGGVFPCVIFQKGKPDNLHYWFKSPDGEEYGPYASYESATASAQRWLEYHNPVNVA